MAAIHLRKPIVEVVAEKRTTRQGVYYAIKAGHLTGEWFGSVRMIVINKKYAAWMPRPYGKHRRERREEQ